MTSEVANRKLGFLIDYLNELKRFEGMNDGEYFPQRFAVERIMQLLVEVANDLLTHLLKDRFNVICRGYKDSFTKAANNKLISRDLGARLEKHGGFRNLLVHQYGEYSPEQVYMEIKPFIDNFSEFIRQVRGGVYITNSTDEHG